MSNNTTKAVNYTAEQEEMLRAAAPLNLEKAQALAETLGKSYRSVIAKARTMGIDYENKAPAKKRPGGVTKPALVERIAAAVGADVESLSGLEKATGGALATLFIAITGAAEDMAESTEG